MIYQLALTGMASFFCKKKIEWMAGITQPNKPKTFASKIKKQRFETLKLILIFAGLK
ncbi:hypothetical protein ACFO3U_02785 [Flavobacterium ponti]|uniref:Uncharacterized protein n=1 Tax=Flavobacterium ponti TaxID=665133 RepID=A0ABV9P1T2_9FLAO